MVSASCICLGLAVLLLVNFSSSDAGRIARSPQFSHAQANAQAGGGFGPRPGFGGPGFGRPGFGGGPGRFYGPGFGRGYYPGGLGSGGFGGRGNGGSISISKSISISRGGASSSNAASSASGK